MAKVGERTCRRVRWALALAEGWLAAHRPLRAPSSPSPTGSRSLCAAHAHRAGADLAAAGRPRSGSCDCWRWADLASDSVRSSAIHLRNALLKDVLAIGFVLTLATPAAAETSGVVDGELRVDDRVIKLTHVYAMQPFQIPDADPSEGTSEGLILILGDREYPGDLPPIEIDATRIGSERPFNGAYLELNRRTGAVLYSRVWYSAEKTASNLGYFLSAPLELTNLRIADGVATARISTVERNGADRQCSGFRAVTPNGTNDKKAETNAASRGIGHDREVNLDATVSVSILPPPRLLKTLYGHDARMSDVAKAHADFLVAERERQIAALKESVVASIRDEATSKRLQEQFDETSLGANEIAAIMAQLEKLYVYDSRAVLRFRTSSIDNVLFAARTGEGPVTLSVVRSGEGSIGVTTNRVTDGATVDVIRSHESTRDSGISSVYASLLMRRPRRIGFIDVHMVKDGGMWRPSTDQWFVQPTTIGAIGPNTQRKRRGIVGGRRIAWAMARRCSRASTTSAPITTACSG